VLVSDFHETYKIKKKIGKGAYADVYLAKHRVTKQKYAVKKFFKKHYMNSINDI